MSPLSDRELALAHQHGVAIVAQHDPGYPGALQTIPDPPPALYIKGRLDAADQAAVAIVGSRNASAYGLSCAQRLASDLAIHGITVVSGLARGIDGAAHRGALAAGGRTIAVLGSGLARLYPPEHRQLAEEIVEQGALISEYPMETEPFGFNFPRRNRLISGLSLGVVVVEAASRSGALITVDCALEQGRDVFAVPGPMTSATSHGTHRLLKQGARLVTSVDDIIEELGLEPPVARPAALEESEASVFACVTGAQPRYLDAIASETGLAVAEVSSALLQLELKQLVRQLPGKQFIRKR